ncbi:MAG: glycosyltransferase family 2 protein [Candidatus Buchananbacteria bacterium]
MAKLISLIIPVYNEKDNIPLIYQALLEQLEKIKDLYDYEMIFVDDGSKDQSLQKIQELAVKNPKVKSLEFSRNFGKEFATTAGLQYCAGDAAILIDADLQHPPKLLPEFLAKWQAGADMVIGIRKSYQHPSLFKTVSSTLFYKIMNFISGTKITEKATDYRLIDRKVINEFNRLTEHNRITRGLLDWLGFKRDYIYFQAEKRINGKVSYNKIKLLKLAISALITHSLFPLKFAGYLGVLIIMFSGPLGFFIFVDKYMINDPFGFAFSGPAILAVINLFLVGITLSCLGLIALYIGNIQTEVMNRPIYIIRSKKNIGKNQ